MILTIDCFNRIKDNYVKMYSDKILSLRSLYIKEINNISISRFKKINKLYRNYIEELIHKLAMEFEKYYDINYCIFLSGSLARNSNNLYSDLDINYLTDEENYNKLIDLEDKVNYILQEVLQFRGRDRIHSMVVYLPLISNRKNNYIFLNKYPLIFSDGIIYNHCRKNSERLMYENYNSTRNIYDVINYFNKNDSELLLNEWTYCFKLVYNDNFLNIYKNYRKIFRDNCNINTFIDKVIEEIKEDNYYLNIDLRETKNSYLKSIYKTKVLFNFYKFLAVFYRLDKNVSEFNLDSFYKKCCLLNKKVFEAFYSHLMNIQNLQLILDYYDDDLSSHSDELLDIEKINVKYTELTGKSSIIHDLNYTKRELYDLCIILLRRNKK